MEIMQKTLILTATLPLILPTIACSHGGGLDPKDTQLSLESVTAKDVTRACRKSG